MLKWEGLHMEKQNCSRSLISQHASCVFESQPITVEFLWTVGVQIKRAYRGVVCCSSLLFSCFLSSSMFHVLLQNSCHPPPLHLHSGIKVKVQQSKLTWRYCFPPHHHLLNTARTNPNQVSLGSRCVCVCFCLVFFTGTFVIQCYQEGLPEPPTDSRYCP